MGIFSYNDELTSDFFLSEGFENLSNFSEFWDKQIDFTMSLWVDIKIAKSRTTGYTMKCSFGYKDTLLREKYFNIKNTGDWFLFRDSLNPDTIYEYIKY